MTAWEFQDNGVEREARAGCERTPAYVHYHDIIPAYGRQRAAGLDIIVDSAGHSVRIDQRLTNENGVEVAQL